MVVVRGMSSLPEGLGVRGRERESGDAWVHESKVYTQPRDNDSRPMPRACWQTSGPVILSLGFVQSAGRSADIFPRVTVL